MQHTQYSIPKYLQVGIIMTEYKTKFGKSHFIIESLYITYPLNSPCVLLIFGYNFLRILLLVQGNILVVKEYAVYYTSKTDHADIGQHILYLTASRLLLYSNM